MSSGLAEKYFEKALDAVKIRDYDRALGLLVEAIKFKPEFTEAWVVRGNILHAQDRPFEALLHYDRALSFDEGKHDAWNNRGLAFADLGMWSGAEACFRRSAELMPAIEPHIGLANMFCTIMRLQDAADEYREAIKIDPGCADAHFNLGVTLLGLGQWREGFKEYELRWRNTPYPPRSLRDYIKWRGENLTGKRILLYPEQGYGDEIMALRFALDIHERYQGSTVIVQARGPMLRLTESLRRDGILVVPMNSDKEYPADYSCPLLDVPMMLKMEPGEVLRGRYLSAPDRDRVGYWCERLNTLPRGNLNVGLCWSSGTHMNTARAAQQAKSIPLPWLKGLALAGVNLISLQKPQEAIPAGFPIVDWMDECHDFADTAALVEALDLVISVDTAVAHLAGSLGKPVANFVRFSGYWPWLALPEVAPTMTHSIWYPSMQLFRQPALANWQEPIRFATDWLRSHLKEQAA